MFEFKDANNPEIYEFRTAQHNYNMIKVLANKVKAQILFAKMSCLNTNFIVIIPLVLWNLATTNFNTKMKNESPLTITISDLRSPTAKVYIALCEKTKNFPHDQKQIKGFEIDPKGRKELTVTIEDLAFGEYAVTTFQDLDGDKKLSTNFLGAPAEPFGFSNNYKPMFRAPKWSDCSFQYSKTNSAIRIKLIKLF